MERSGRPLLSVPAPLADRGKGGYEQAAAAAAAGAVEQPCCSFSGRAEPPCWQAFPPQCLAFR